MNTYAFVDENGIVVQTIQGTLREDQIALFLRDYSTMFGAAKVLTVSSDTSIWIGGRYDSAEGFLPPEPPAETIVNDAI